jgi:hypothetical protein
VKNGNEFKLQTYTFDEGPSYPRGRRNGESVGDFIRRVQRKELYSATKNIFAPVQLKYNLRAAINQRLAAQRKKQYSRLSPDAYTN